MRYKASLLRIPGSVDFSQDLLTDGLQVAISVAFLKTSSMLLDALRGRGWKADAINGAQSAEANEAARLAFQTGELDMIVFTVTEIISLHRRDARGRPGTVPAGARHASQRNSARAN